MPRTTARNRRVHPVGGRSGAPAYVELHAHSGFSFLDGASLPDELAAAAAELGYGAMALTDHDGIWGSMEFAQACAGLDVHPITGCELTVALPGAPLPAAPHRESCPSGCFHLTLLVETERGYTNLCRLLTKAHAHTREWNGADEGAPNGEWKQIPPGEGKTSTHGGARGSSRGPLPSAAGNARRRGTTRRFDLTHPVLPFADLTAPGAVEGLVALSGCARDGALGGRILRSEYGLAERLGRELLDAFGPDSFRVELQRPFWKGDRTRNRRLEELAGILGVPTVATGNVHYHHRRRAALQDALVAVRLLGTLESTEPNRRGNGSGFLVGPKRMAMRFAEHPEALDETVRLAERLRFDLTRDLGYRYPGSEDPDADRKLAETCAARFGERYDGRPHRAEAERRLQDELEVIAKLGLSGFFLLHRDLLELARDVALEVRGPSEARNVLPPGRGRGSSVSSVVCYLTGLSHVDPVEAGLFLGRFLNDEITEAPDIDLDFPRDVREVLIPRIHERYGAERSALVAAFPTYKARGVVRELGGALGLPQGEIERVARSVSPYGYPVTHAAASAGDTPDLARPGRDDVSPEGLFEADIAEAIGAARARSERWQALIRLASETRNMPRHASQHPGGMILSTRPLTDLCPVVPAAMEGRRIAQWDKDSCSDAGFLKIDLLGLGMLSAVERTVDEIHRARGETIDLSRIPLDDPQVYRAIQKAETTGVFQIESRAQMQMLPRSLPENIDDLTVQVALVRPGPIQGGAVHPYLERKKALREDPTFEVPYEHPSLVEALSDTLGAIVFQDQVIQVSMALAGFSSGEAEGLRRAMSRKRSEEALNAYRGRFVEGALENGVDEATAHRVYDQIKGFSGFGFPKSHAAAFGLLAYQSTWLRVHFAAEFLCGLMNEQPMGFYPVDALVHEAQRRGVPILGPSVNRSGVHCAVEWTAADADPEASRSRFRDRDDGIATDAEGRVLGVRVGLGYVTGLHRRDAEAVVRSREEPASTGPADAAGPTDTTGHYADLGDLASRSGATRDGLERLAWAGACGELGAPAGSRQTERPSTGAMGGTQGRSVRSSRREDLWRLGIARGSVRRGGDEQMALPLEVPGAPELRPQSEWERVTSDYGSIGISLGTHPVALMRPELDPRTVSSADLENIADGSEVLVAGMTVARQRPATAKGVTFMLIEDEWGMTNVIVLPPVYERQRLLVRTASFVSIAGKLERREGVVNILAGQLSELERPDLELADVHTLEPSPSRETGGSISDLGAVLPAAHSFGRRGR